MSLCQPHTSRLLIRLLIIGDPVGLPVLKTLCNHWFFQARTHIYWLFNNLYCHRYPLVHLQLNLTNHTEVFSGSYLQNENKKQLKKRISVKMSVKKRLQPSTHTQFICCFNTLTESRAWCSSLCQCVLGQEEEEQFQHPLQITFLPRTRPSHWHSFWTILTTSKIQHASGWEFSIRTQGLNGSNVSTHSVNHSHWVWPRSEVPLSALWADALGWH